MKPRNGCTPEQNSKVFNALVTGSAVAAAFMIFPSNHKGKVVAASLSAPLPSPIRNAEKPNENRSIKLVSSERSTLDKIRDAVYARDSKPDITWPFIEQILPAALNDECPSVLIAQAVHETDSGTSELSQVNNYFGIKCFKPLNEYPAEVLALLAPPYRVRKHDSMENSNDFYFVFKSPDACFQYRKMNLERQRYQRQINRIPNPRYFAQWAVAIAKGGWATDDFYADRLIEKIEKFELYLLD